MITEQLIREAYLFMRKHNNSIPDEVLDFMLYHSLAALHKNDAQIEAQRKAQELLYKIV